MHGREHLKKTFLESIANKEAYRLEMSARTNKDTIARVMNTGLVSMYDLDTAITQSIEKEAHQSYKAVTERNHHPDHVANPSVLVYAVQHNIFSEKEKELLSRRIDHGLTLNQFCDRYYDENLIETTRKRILEPKPFAASQKDKYIDPHPVCSCGY